MYRQFLLQKPPGYVTACIVTSLGGFLFGVDTGIIGPVTVMPDFTQYAKDPSPTIHGLIVSSILIPAALSSFFAGRLADALGRPKAIAIGSLMFGLGAALEAASIHIAMFVCGRVMEGVGEGLYLGNLVVYICEISPPKTRGVLTTGPQLLITLGLVVGFFTCYGTANMESTFSWRMPFILLAAYAFAFAGAALLWLPASPRWLTLRGRNSEALEAWEKLGVPSADREKIMDEHPTVVIENAGTDGNSPASPGSAAPATTTLQTRTRPGKPGKAKATVADLFAPDSRARLFLAVFLMGMQQLSGIDGVLYYAPILFQQAGLSSTQASFLASGVSAIVIFAVTIPATIFADGWSRRASLILGGVGIGLTMFLMGALYAGGAVHATSGAGRWVVVVSIYVFAVIYCITWGISIKIFAAEIQPQKTRATATSIAHGTNWLANFLVALVTPTLLATTSYGAYFLFGGCATVTALVCWAYMPETRGKSLDEIEQAFHESKGNGLHGLKSLGRAVRRRLPGGN